MRAVALCVSLLATMPATGATTLEAEPLPGAGRYERPVDYAAYAAPAAARTPEPFEGRLVIRPRPGDAHVAVLRDDYGDARDPDRRIAELPVMDVAFVLVGDSLVPVVAGLVRTPHPRWDYLVGEGRAWRSADDRGIHARPFRSRWPRRTRIASTTACCRSCTGPTATSRGSPTR